VSARTAARKKSSSATSTNAPLHRADAAANDGCRPRRRTLFWRFVFPIVLAGLAVASFQLWRTGTKAVLDSTDGTVVEVVSDPDAPGYQAFAVPTPTMLTLHIDDGELVGVTVLARTLLEGGGQLVLVSSDLAADGASGPTLADVYADEGRAGVERSVGKLFGFGFLETLEIDTVSFGRLLELAEPIAFNLLDDLISTDADGTEVWLERGGTLLDGEACCRRLSLAQSRRGRCQPQRAPSRSVGELACVDRRRRRPDCGDTPVRRRPFSLSPCACHRSIRYSTAAGRSLRRRFGAHLCARRQRDGLARRGRRSHGAPSDSGTRCRCRHRPPSRWHRRSRPRREARGVVARLSELVIVGNAAEFGLATTTVSYHDEANAPLAEALATQLGAEVAADLRPDEPVDLTVTIGTDWEIP
jgi:hypothetical protein